MNLSTICHVEFLEQHCIQVEMLMPLTLHLSKWWCVLTNLGFSFLGHIASSCIHIHNDQISYNNDIEFFIYQTFDHLVDLGFDSILYKRNLQDCCYVLLLRSFFLFLLNYLSPCLYHGLWMIVLEMHLPMMYLIY